MTAPPTTIRDITSTHWQLGRQFMLRVGGLPYETVAQLGCPESTLRASEILDLEAALARDGEPLSDLLHNLIGANDDADSRRTLLSLRRQIFKERLPADPDAALAAVAALEPLAVASVRDWIDRQRRIAQLRQDLTDVLAREVADTRDELWRLSNQPRLRAGIQVASPVLDEQLAVLAGRTGAPPPAKKLRRVERSILSYLYRTACKTSPFSTFTGIGVGSFDSDPAMPAVTVPLQWRNSVRLNVVVIARITEAINADRDRRGDLSVVLSPGLSQDTDRVRYVRRWIIPGDNSAAVSLDMVQDGLFYLRRSGILDRLTALLQGGTAWRCADLAAWLRRHSQATEDQSEEYLSILLRLGILQIDGFAVDVHTPDPVRHFRDFMTTLDRPWATRLAGRLDDVIEQIETFRTGGLDARRTAVRQLRSRLQEIQLELGAATTSVPQTLLYEDCPVDAPLAASDDPWTGMVAGDLAAVQDILPAFDISLPQQILFRGFFLARYGRGGRCDDLLRLVEDFHEDLYDQYLSVTSQIKSSSEDGMPAPEENWLAQPELTALDRMRRDFAGYVRVAVSADPDGDELRLDPAVLRRLGRDLGDKLGGHLPRAHFIQVADGASGPLFVLNQSMGGLSFPFSRFTYGFDDATSSLSDQLRAQAVAAAPPGAVFAEVTGGQATTNLNLHGQLTDYVIVCPGETTIVPQAEQLDLDDLYVQHDVDTNRVTLRSRRLDRDVIPVYLGYLIPMMLPQLHRTLLLLSPTSMAGIDIWRGVPKEPDTRGVTARPRVRVGDLVISRRSWTVAGELLPRRAVGVTDADWFLGWTRWRRELGLPARTFATVHGPQKSLTAARPKPQYVDFDSFLSLLALEAQLHDDTERVAFREMLPYADELGVRSSDGSHVAEFAIETFPRNQTTSYQENGDASD